MKNVNVENTNSAEHVKSSEEIYQSLTMPMKITQRIARIVSATFIAGFISGFGFYWAGQIFDYNFFELIMGILAFIFIFRFVMSKQKYIDPETFKYNGNSTGMSDFTPCDINNPRNPCSYMTPGSPNYAFDSADRERDRYYNNSSTFSNNDYYNR